MPSDPVPLDAGTTTTPVPAVASWSTSRCWRGRRSGVAPLHPPRRRGAGHPGRRHWSPEGRTALAARAEALVLGRQRRPGADLAPGRRRARRPCSPGVPVNAVATGACAVPVGHRRVRGAVVPRALVRRLPRWVGAARGLAALDELVAALHPWSPSPARRRRPNATSCSSPCSTPPSPRCSTRDVPSRRHPPLAWRPPHDRPQRDPAHRPAHRIPGGRGARRPRRDLRRPAD